MSEGTPKTQRSLGLQPGTLRSRLGQQTQFALECGALQPIPTEYEFLEEDGLRFLVRSLSNLARKDRVRKQQQSGSGDRNFNPFLPCERDLFVADLSDTHLCLLNKYNVVDRHLLIITRDFEAQETWLTLPDFQALWACLAEVEGLAFYNGGKDAGASQHHKHLQLVPFPLVPNGENIPIEEAIAAARVGSSAGTVPHFPFPHAVAKLDLHQSDSPSEVAETLLECYRKLLKAVNLHYHPERDRQQSGAYNLLATRQWMAVVPRSRESFEAIAVNALGFAGTLFVRNEEQMQRLKDLGPIAILKSVARTP